MVRTPACHAGGRGFAPVALANSKHAISTGTESHVGETVRLDSDLIFYANDHQGHVVPLRGAVGKGGDLIQDAFYDLRWPSITARTQQVFKPLHSPQFIVRTFGLRDSSPPVFDLNPSAVTISANEGQPQREPCISLSNVGSHSFPSAVSQLAPLPHGFPSLAEASHGVVVLTD